MNNKNIQTLGLSEIENKIIKNEIVPIIEEAYSQDKYVSETIENIYNTLQVLADATSFNIKYFSGVTVNCYIADIGSKRYKFLIQRGL